MTNCGRMVLLIDELNVCKEIFLKKDGNSEKFYREASALSKQIHSISERCIEEKERLKELRKAREKANERNDLFNRINQCRQT